MSPTMITSLFGSILRIGKTFTPPLGTPNGIAELQPVELNGYPQWLLIRGQDVSRPVLLYLHGGPGESHMWLAHYTMKELEQHFVCVNWDQRGTGKSFRPTVGRCGMGDSRSPSRYLRTPPQPSSYQMQRPDW